MHGLCILRVLHEEGFLHAEAQKQEQIGYLHR